MSQPPGAPPKVAKLPAPEKLLQERKSEPGVGLGMGPACGGGTGSGAGTEIGGGDGVGAGSGVGTGVVGLEANPSASTDPPSPKNKTELRKSEKQTL